MMSTERVCVWRSYSRETRKKRREKKKDEGMVNGESERKSGCVYMCVYVCEVEYLWWWGRTRTNEKGRGSENEKGRRERNGERQMNEAKAEGRERTRKEIKEAKLVLDAKMFAIQL